jgi:hypothetical protein
MLIYMPHACSISGENAAVIWKVVLLLKDVRKEVSAVLEIGWAEVYNVLGMVIDPHTEWSWNRGHAANN